MRQFPLPVTQRWRVRIERVEAPVAVVDVALSGPFAAWRHEHLFAVAGDGRTLLTDHVTYELPLGALGRLVDRIVVRRVLVRTFHARHARTRAILG